MLTSISITFYILAYLFGSINSAIIICKLLGLPSPRSIGSGNPGATNVMRLGGKKAAALTLFFDLIKGLFIVLVAHLYIKGNPVLLTIGFFAIIGHIFPIFFKFKGGKGVATYIGALLGATPLLGIVFLASWIVIYGLFRISSLSALLALIICPIVSFFYLPLASSIVLILMSLTVIIRHHSNIKRLILGAEKKV